MKFVAPLLAVKDMDVSRRFYTEVMNQKVTMDIQNVNVTFDGGFALQAGFAELVGFEPQETVYGSKAYELYFEEEALDDFAAELEKRPEIQKIHGVKEYPWGQRVIRFYDPDRHVIEVGEPMETVVTRFLRGGMSVEEAAERSMFPLEFVKHCRDTMR